MHTEWCTMLVQSGECAMPVIRQDIEMRHVCKCGEWFDTQTGLNRHIQNQGIPEHGDLAMLARMAIDRGLIDRGLMFQALLEQHRMSMRRRNRGMPSRKALIRQMRARDAKAAKLSAYMARLGYPETAPGQAADKLASIGLDTRSNEEQCGEILAESDARLDDVNKLFD